MRANSAVHRILSGPEPAPAPDRGHPEGGAGVQAGPLGRPAQPWALDGLSRGIPRCHKSAPHLAHPWHPSLSSRPARRLSLASPGAACTARSRQNSVPRILELSAPAALRLAASGEPAPRNLGLAGQSGEWAEAAWGGNAHRVAQEGGRGEGRS